MVVEKGIEIMSPEQIILGKSEDHVPKVLNEEQMKRLFEVQDLNKRSGVRDHAILEIYLVQVYELVSL
jgi:site-specific recombinase XerD